VFYAHNKSRKDYRMAVIVSKKTAKSAVVRNRIRRRLYEVVRTMHFLDNRPIDAVFVVHSDELATLPHDQLLMQMQRVADKIAH
jgi:ribonuclease P protein component